MEYRMFGKSGLKVSALGYGCMTFGDPSNGNVRACTLPLAGTLFKCMTCFYPAWTLSESATGDGA